ncbi:hypothetical protein CDAR_397371 [Caerostris darwini]|uniref:Ycf15 n=1 Tax=Caerostris darwini TaxID=1538125 RepID=A0AAV4T1A1_9ARAC|nr:hypothetical protein CDAR_397371 [Caerostris darwini]
MEGGGGVHFSVGMGCIRILDGGRGPTLLVPFHDLRRSRGMFHPSSSLLRPIKGAFILCVRNDRKGASGFAFNVRMRRFFSPASNGT